MLSFDGLEAKYGCAVAYNLLLQIEKAAHIASWSVSELDHETRLRNALHAQDAMNAPVSAAA